VSHIVKVAELLGDMARAMEVMDRTLEFMDAANLRAMIEQERLRRELEQLQQQRRQVRGE